MYNTFSSTHSDNISDIFCSDQTSMELDLDESCCSATTTTTTSTTTFSVALPQQPTEQALNGYSSHNLAMMMANPFPSSSSSSSLWLDGSSFELEVSGPDVVNDKKRKTSPVGAAVRKQQSSKTKKLKLLQPISGLVQENNPCGVLKAKLKQKVQHTYALPLFSPGHASASGRPSATKIVVQFQSEFASNRGIMEVQYRDTSVGTGWNVAFRCQRWREKNGSWGKMKQDGSFACSFAPPNGSCLGFLDQRQQPWMRAVYKCDDGASCVLFYFGYCNRDDARAERSEQYLASIPVVTTSNMTQHMLHCYLN